LGRRRAKRNRRHAQRSCNAIAYFSWRRLARSGVKQTTLEFCGAFAAQSFG
jgi:hypothetical protein